jgi:hypothetical protein
MDPIQRPIVIPTAEIVIDCAARRQIFRQRRPLAARAEDVHHPVHHRSHIDRSLIAALLRRRDQRPDQRPLLVRQITRVAQPPAVISRPVLQRPHLAAPANRFRRKRITGDSSDSRCSRTDTKRSSHRLPCRIAATAIDLSRDDATPHTLMQSRSRMIADAPKHVGQPRTGIDVVQLGGDDERVH